MQKFGFENEKHRSELFDAMEGKNQELPWVEVLQSVMEDIQRLLDVSYSLGINPLNGLRKVLPQYQWRFYRIRNEERYEGHVKEVVSKSDFVWRIWYDEDDFQLVTATKLDRAIDERQRNFWVGSNKAHCFVEEVAFAEEFGGTPVFWEEEA